MSESHCSSLDRENPMSVSRGVVKERLDRFGWMWPERDAKGSAAVRTDDANYRNRPVLDGRCVDAVTAVTDESPSVRPTPVGSPAATPTGSRPASNLIRLVTATRLTSPRPVTERSVHLPGRCFEISASPGTGPTTFEAARKVTHVTSSSGESHRNGLQSPSRQEM